MGSPLIRVGVIGVGNIGTAHAENLARTVAGSTVTAVYDYDATRAAHVARDLGAEAVDSAEALIAHPDVDAVVIASPDGMHAEQALACIAAGKPVLCEKPLAPELDNAQRVMDAEIAGGRRLITMGFMRRFDPGYLALKAELDSGVVGDPLLLHCVHRNVSPAPGQTSAKSLTNAVVHEIDINRWLLDDEYASVQIMSGKPSRHAEGDLRDPLLVFLRTTRGVLVEVEFFVNARYGYEVRCEVVATEGSVQMTDAVHITSARELAIGRSLPEQWLGRFGEAYRLEMQGWIDALRTGTVTGASAWDGYMATLVANTCIQALDTDAAVAVEMPERPSLYR